MSDHTPTQQQTQEIPYGYCHCGCGELAPIFTKTDSCLGRIKGEPARFVHGHNRRKPIVAVEIRLCMCGCGNPTPIARQTDSKLGYIKGQPIRYIAGHQARKYLPAPDGFRTCTMCEKTKPATTDYFRPSKTCKGGLRGICKTCQKATVREHIAANKERFIEEWRVYRAANTEKMRLYRQANKEKIAEQNRLYVLINKEHLLERRRLYWRANPDKSRAHYNRRRALKRDAQGNHTRADVRRQYKAQKGKCYYCGVEVGETYHVDHVIPLSRGGSDGPENLVIACARCNESKGNRLPHEWAKGGRLL